MASKFVPVISHVVLSYIKVSDFITTTCLAMPTGHLSMMTFPCYLNPNLLATTEPQVFIAKHITALLQFPSAVSSMCSQLYVQVGFSGITFLSNSVILRK